MNEIVQILMQRDGFSFADANRELQFLKNEVLNGGSPEEVLLGIGLEPDYIFALLDSFC